MINAVDVNRSFVIKNNRLEDNYDELISKTYQEALLITNAYYHVGYTFDEILLSEAVATL